MALEESGVRLVAEGQREFESALDAGNQALAGFGRAAEESGGLLSGFGEIAVGALRRVGEIAVDSLIQAGQAVVQFGVDSFNSALEAEQSLTRINTLLEGQAQAATEQAAAYADAQGKFVSFTRASDEELDKWSDQLRKAEAQYADLQTRLVDKEPTETQKVQLLELQENIAGLTLKIQHGGQVIQQSLVDALGLVPPEAQLTLEGLQDLANEFAPLAGGTDDVILAIEEMALRMGNISGEEMPQFIQASLDLAAATGVDAVSGARLLSQAQEDASSVVLRLRRQGILFTEQQEEQIKTLQKAGKNSEAYAIVMERVGQATGGAALANSRTIAGQIEILKNTLSEAGEAALTGFLPVLHTLTEEVLPKLLPFITDLGNAIGAAFGALGDGDLGGAFDALAQFESVQAILSALGVSTEQVYAFGAAVETAIGQAGQSFQNFLLAVQPVTDAVTNVVAAFTDSLPMIAAIAQETFAAVSDTVSDFFPVIVDNVADSLNTISEFWRKHGDLILALTGAAFQAIAFITTSVLTVVSGFISATLTAIGGLFDFWTAVFTGNWQAAHDAWWQTSATIWFTIQQTIESIFNSVLAYLGTSLDDLRATWKTDWDLIEITLKTAWERIEKAVVDGVNEIKLRLARGVLDAIENLRGLLDLFYELGKAVVNSIAYGIQETIDYLADVMLAGIREVIHKAEVLLGISSPSRVFMEIGRNIALGIAAGIQEEAESVSEAVDSLFSAGGIIGGLGGAAAGRFESRVIDPLRAELEGLDGLLEKAREEFGEGLSPIEFIAQMERGLAIGFGPSAEEAERLRLAERLLDLESQRADIAANLAEQEARVLELQKQQDDLAFLQQQVKLLDLIQEYGLDAQSVLGDLVLGVNADLPSIIDATTRALQEIISQVSVGLGFAPPLPAPSGETGISQTFNANLSVNTQQTSGNVISDFALLRALAGT